MSRRALLAAAEGWRHLVRHPLRSALSAATCAVAVAVTVDVISLAYGLDADIRGDIARFGRDTIDVGRAPLLAPGRPRPPFGEAELERVRAAVAGLDAVVVPLRGERGVATGEATADPVVLAAVSADYPRTLSIGMAAGRWFDPSASPREAVLDESLARALFPGAAPRDAVGRDVRVSLRGGEAVRVVGVLEDPMTYRALFEAFDEGREARTLISALLSFRNVYVPSEAIPTADLTTVHVVLPPDRFEEGRRRLEALWPAAGDLGAPIAVFARRTWMEAFGGATQTGALLGNVVWILVCLVACVMVSTLNLVTIRERYDEVAVRRCEGARRRDVVVQVAAEGLALSVAGGLVGLPLGWLGAAAMRRIVDVPFGFDPRYAAVAVGVSVVLGLVSAALPARRAASLAPAAVLSRRLT